MIAANSTGRFCRLLFAAAAALAVSPALAVTPEMNWTFGVLLDDKRIGYHEFQVTEDGDRRILRTEAEFDVKFLFITAFQYRHDNIEAWEDDCLVSIDAQTDSNGKALAVQGTQQERGFVLQSSAGNAEIDGCVQTFAYWNPDILDAERLLNSQTGEFEDISVTMDGSEPVRVGDQLIPATRFRLSAKAGDIMLWYSTADSRWLALEAPAKGGRILRYEPLVVPEADGANDLLASRD